MQLSEVRSAIKTRLDARSIAGLRVFESWPDVLTFEPTGCGLAIGDVQIEYEQTFGTGQTDMGRADIELHLFTSAAGGLVNGQNTMDRYISNTGPSSILQTFREDPTLGGTVANCLPPHRIRDYGIKEIGGNVQVVGAVIDLEVYFR